MAKSPGRPEARYENRLLKRILDEKQKKRFSLKESSQEKLKSMERQLELKNSQEKR